MRRSAIPATIIFLLLVGIGGFFLGSASMFHLGRENTRLTKINQELSHKIREEQVVLFFLESAPANSFLKPVLYRVKSNGDLHVNALKALFAGPPDHSKLLAIFPKETKVLGFRLTKGIAYVNLNQNAAQLNVGSTVEALAVASIVNTLTKFPDVFRVKILIEGKDAESLAGHVDVTGLLRYNDQVVDPDFFETR
jgi:spore germination protein GerM